MAYLTEAAIFTALVVLVSVIQVAESATYCRGGWSYYGRECFYVNNNHYTVEDAKAWCESYESELAVIHSSGANSHVTSLISGISSSTAHIGFSDVGEEGTWAWYNGDSVAYTNFNPGEPNGGYDKNCAGMYRSGKWDDYLCTEQRAFVCRTLAQYTATSTGCHCSWDTTRTDCACCLNGGTHCGANYPHECAQSSGYCGTRDNTPLQDVDDWVVVFKVPRYTNVRTYDLWTGGGTYNPDVADGPVLSSTSYVYKGHAANSYNTNNIKEVKYAFFTSGKEVASITFDTTSTDKNSWFADSKDTHSTWSDLYSSGKNYFSMYGSGHRTYFVNKNYGGCSVDAGWMVTSDVNNGQGCDWDQWYSKPYFIYSTASTAQAWSPGSRSFAENVAILFRYYDTDDTDEILCDSGWDLLGNACYLSSGDTTATWKASLAACKAMRIDADLTSIQDATENTRVLAMIRKTYGNNAHWIGANDLTQEGNWTWTDGSLWHYENWHASEPSGDGGLGNCAIMRWSAEGNWNDAACSNSNRYICKYPLRQYSCADWKRKGWTSDGYYTIDPDGPYSDGMDPTRVYCDMNSDGNTGITRFDHNQETRQHVTGYENAHSYSRDISYDNGLDAVTTVADLSGSCSQYIKIECQGSTLDSFSYSRWYNRDGTGMSYMGGAPQGSGKCACGHQGNCAGGYGCHCTMNDGTLRTDEGYLEYKDDLPVTRYTAGDTGDGSEYQYHQIYPLYCKSDESILISTRSDFYMIKDRAISAFNNEHISVASAELCAAECVARTAFICRSFDFNTNQGVCYMSEENDKTQADAIYTLIGSHLFVRIMPTNVNPNHDDTNNCLDNWAEYNGNCFFAETSQETWLDAEMWCQQNGGGHLAIPVDDDEHEFMQMIMRWAAPTDDEIWIGINDIENEGIWTDPELNEVNYTRWRNTTNEPSGGDEENGAIMYMNSAEDWINVGQDETYPFICKAAIGADLIAAPSTNQLCRSGWDFNDHSCYYYSTASKTWDAAETHCQSMQSSLVVVETDREFDYLKNYYRYRYNNDFFWMGLTDVDEEGVWKWTSGPQTTYPSTGAYWKIGSPGSEHCGVFQAPQVYNDASCDSSYKYICEDDTRPNAWPENLNIAILSADTLRITWEDPYDVSVQNDDVTGYKIKYWDSNQFNASVVDINDASTYDYILEGLAPGTTYDIAILAYTANGDGPQMLVNVTTTSTLKRTSKKRLGQFEIKSRSRLTNHVLYSFETVTLTQCTNTCLSDDRCLSVNYHYRSTDMQKLCEINSETHFYYPDDLEEQTNFQYAAIPGV